LDERYGSDYISLSDEDGNEYELEHLDTMEIDNAFYLVFLPADISEDDERFGIVIMKAQTDENGEDYLVVPNDDETQKAYDMYMQRLFEEEEDEIEE